ncbi:g3928 [Coccomyxa elongata]
MDFDLPPMLLDPLGPEDLVPVSVERSGMISDSSIVELQRTRRILEGKDPLAEGGSSRSGSRLMSSAGLLRGSVMAQSRLVSVRTAAA